jgi:hypothetical protein
MEQKSFADLEYDHKKRKTRRELFLERMDTLIPWKSLEKRGKAWKRVSENTIPKVVAEDARPIHCPYSCESTAFNSSTNSLTQRWKICCTKSSPFVALPVSN